MSNVLTNLGPGNPGAFFMNNQDTLSTHLRNGGFLLVQDKAGTWLLGSYRHADAFAQQLEKLEVPLAGTFVLISAMNQLYDYVLRFSDLAWEIAEGSEKALLIWYDNPKVTAPLLLDAEKNVGVMLNRCKTLQPLLQKLGWGLVCQLLPPSENGWQGMTNVLPLPLEAGCRLAPERIMRLGSQGDVKFLKY